MFSKSIAHTPKSNAARSMTIILPSLEIPSTSKTFDR